MMPTAMIFYDPRDQWRPVSQALETCFRSRGWRITSWSEHAEEPDVYGGYGWCAGMRAAYARWPSKLLHLDAAFWARDRYFKLTLGGRWEPLDIGGDYDESRLRQFGVMVQASRESGSRVLVCGMGPKSVAWWGLKPEEWERDAIAKLKAAGAIVTYRPKPSWSGARPIPGCAYSSRKETIAEALTKVDAVASHHSNCGVDAAAAGLPFYTDTGIAKPLSVATLEDVVGANAQPGGSRARFLRQVAWYQWTLDEIASGAWMSPPAPLAPAFAS